MPGPVVGHRELDRLGGIKARAGGGREIDGARGVGGVAEQADLDVVVLVRRDREDGAEQKGIVRGVEPPGRAVQVGRREALAGRPAKGAVGEQPIDGGDSGVALAVDELVVGVHGAQLGFLGGGSAVSAPAHVGHHVAGLVGRHPDHVGHVVPGRAGVHDNVADLGRAVHRELPGVLDRGGPVLGVAAGQCADVRAGVGPPPDAVAQKIPGHAADTLFGALPPGHRVVPTAALADRGKGASRPAGAGADVGRTDEGRGRQVVGQADLAPGLGVRGPEGEGAQHLIVGGQGLQVAGIVMGDLVDLVVKGNIGGVHRRHAAIARLDAQVGILPAEGGIDLEGSGDAFHLAEPLVHGDARVAVPDVDLDLGLLAAEGDPLPDDICLSRGVLESHLGLPLCRIVYAVAELHAVVGFPGVGVRRGRRLLCPGRTATGRRELHQHNHQQQENGPRHPPLPHGSTPLPAHEDLLGSENQVVDASLIRSGGFQ